MYTRTRHLSRTRALMEQTSSSARPAPTQPCTRPVRAQECIGSGCAGSARAHMTKTVRCAATLSAARPRRASLGWMGGLGCGRRLQESHVHRHGDLGCSQALPKVARVGRRAGAFPRATDAALGSQSFRKALNLSHRTCMGLTVSRSPICGISQTRRTLWLFSEISRGARSVAALTPMRGRPRHYPEGPPLAPARGAAVPQRARLPGCARTPAR